ncbi:MAG TPA: hypothetical protein VGD59_15400 [Acidisarcina sp.]
MLKIVEYGIFAVSLLAILALIVSGARSSSASRANSATEGATAEPSTGPSDSAAAPLGSTKKP